MTRHGRHGITAIMSVFIISLNILFAAIPCYAEHENYFNEQLEAVMRGIVAWKEHEQGVGEGELFSSDFAKSAASSAGDWYAFAIGRTGIGGDHSSYLAMLKNNTQELYEKGDLKATDLQRIALTMLALGGDPQKDIKDRDGKSIDLIAEGTYDNKELSSQGVNAYIWGLITLDSKRYELADDKKNVRDEFISEILKKQSEDGGFSLDGKSSDTDITAMAIQALSAYYNVQENVNDAIDRAIDHLSSTQNEDGGFSSWGEANAESTAQVITAVCSVGIDPDSDSRFIKNGCTPLDGLMKYKLKDGGFAHSEIDGEMKSNSMASEQALYALCALYRYRTGMRGLYDLRDDENSTAGAVTDIFSRESVSDGVRFSESDIEKFDQLPQELTGENYNTVIMLYEKLMQAENSEEYSDIADKLTEMEKQVTQIKSEVESINAEIAEKLYPFDDITSDDRETVDKLVERTGKLSEYDCSQVLGYDDLMRAKAKVDGDIRKVYIGVAVGVLAALCAVVIVARVKKKRRSAKQKQAFDNEEW